jgi:hypothetical protein
MSIAKLERAVVTKESKKALGSLSREGIEEVVAMLVSGANASWTPARM